MEYNNIWIKEKDKCKVAFMMLEGLFKPIVIFFRLIISLVMFQIIMKKILQDLINTREVRSFINNVIVETGKKEGHNKVVEIVKKLAENNLYVKLEKCKWKIRKVGFLGVIIELEEIKIKEEKIKKYWTG